MHWRLLHSPPLDGAMNMATDEALMARARRTGEAVLRVYSWRRPTLSLGRNQRALDVYDEHALRERGVDVVRRPTGGRALLHDREVTYSVTAPASPKGLGAEYRRINALLVSALHALGVAASEARPAERASRPGAAPCFAEPAAGELVLEGRKLVGSAQWRDGGALLQHGSILLDDDQSAIPSLMKDRALPPPPPATLRQALGRIPSVDEVAAALFGAALAHADAAAEPLDADDVLDRDVAALDPDYRDPRWTWRR